MSGRTMFTPSAVHVPCPCLIKAHRPASLGTISNVLFQKRPVHCTQSITNEEELCSTDQSVPQSKDSCYLKSRYHGQIKGVRRTQQKGSPSNTVQNSRATKTQSSLPSIISGNQKRLGKKTDDRVALVHFISEKSRCARCFGIASFLHNINNAPKDNLLRGSQDKGNATCFSLQSIYQNTTDYGINENSTPTKLEILLWWRNTSVLGLGRNFPVKTVAT